MLTNLSSVGSSATSELVPECCWKLIAAYSDIVTELFAIPGAIGIKIDKIPHKRLDKRVTREQQQGGLNLDQGCPGHRFIPLRPTFVINYLVTPHIGKRLQLLKAYFDAKKIALASSSPNLNTDEITKITDSIEKLDTALPKAHLNKWVVVLSFILLFFAVVWLANFFTPLTQNEVNATAALGAGLYGANGPEIVASLMNANMIAAFQKLIIPLFFFVYASGLIIYYFTFKRWLFNYPTPGTRAECTIDGLWGMGACKKSGTYALEHRVFQKLGINEPSEWPFDLIWLAVMDITIVLVLIYASNNWWLIALRDLYPTYYIGIFVGFGVLCVFSFYVFLSWAVGRRNDVRRGAIICELRNEIHDKLRDKLPVRSPYLDASKTWKQRISQKVILIFPILTFVLGGAFVVFTAITQRVPSARPDQFAILLKPPSALQPVDEAIRAAATLAVAIACLVILLWMTSRLASHFKEKSPTVQNIFTAASLRAGQQTRESGRAALRETVTDVRQNIDFAKIQERAQEAPKNTWERIVTGWQTKSAYRLLIEVDGYATNAEDSFQECITTVESFGARGDRNRGIWSGTLTYKDVLSAVDVELVCKQNPKSATVPTSQYFEHSTG